MFHQLRPAVVAVFWIALAVTFHDTFVFLRKIKCLDQFARREHAEGLLVESVKAIHQTARIHGAAEIIETREQIAAVGETVKRDAVEDHVVLARAGRFEGRIGHPQKTRLTRVRPFHVAHFRRQPDERRDGGIDRPLQFRHRRAETGPAAGRRIFVIATGQTLHRVMVAVGPDDGADERAFVHQPGDFRQMLANLDVLDAGGDRLELPTHFARRVHLQIKHVLMRRPARQENHDDRLVRTTNAGLRLGAEQLRQGNSAEAERADLQKIPARDAIAKTITGFSVNV